ncbi:MAG: hypothetical protein HYS13_05190 [Planctomycetia bacterium]|nr:hypothetical protein [Planctomycetia bacterium]
MFRKAVVVAAIVAALAWGLAWSGQSEDQPQTSNGKSPAAKQLYTCPMHPEIQWPRRDKCPICNMALVPKQARAPAAAEQKSDHDAMLKATDGAAHHDHNGMESMNMPCPCPMCMPGMGMPGQNGHTLKAPAPASGPAPARFWSAPSHAGVRRCGC